MLNMEDDPDYQEFLKMKQMKQIEKDNEKFEALKKKYDTKNFREVLLYCLQDEVGEKKDRDGNVLNKAWKDDQEWLTNIKLCLRVVGRKYPKTEPQYNLPNIGSSECKYNRPTYTDYDDQKCNPQGHPVTILGIMITWNKEHPDVEKFFNTDEKYKLNFYKVMDLSKEIGTGELYMNSWAWGARNTIMQNRMPNDLYTKARPLFLAVLFGKTRWVKKLLDMGAKTDYGYFVQKSLYENVSNFLIKTSKYFRRITPVELNDYFTNPNLDNVKHRLGGFYVHDTYLKARLKYNNPNMDSQQIKNEIIKIRIEIRTLLQFGGAKIKDSGNPQGLKLKY